MSYFVMDLPQSDDCFVKAFPAETTEAFLEGHNRAFAWFGGVPRTILYDNAKLAVAQILGDGTRIKTRAFAELESITCSPRSSAGGEKAMTKAKRKVLLDVRGGTSWCRYRDAPVGRN